MEKVLIIDDDKVDRLMVRELLSGKYTVVEASTGPEGLLSADSNGKPACILLDYRIPGTDTLQLLSEFVGRNIPVVMLTGEGSEEVAVSAMKHGAQDYIRKGNLSEEFLERTIANALQNAALRGALAEKNIQLQDKVAELEVVNSDLESFIHMAAHDLREPMKTLCSYCDLLEREVPAESSAEAREYMETIRRHTRRMTTLIDDLRLLTKIGYGRVFREEFALKDVIEQVIAGMSDKVVQRKASFRYHDLPEITAYRALVAELYRNLVENALKYSKADELIIEFSAENQNGAWVLGVKNNGSQFAPDEVERLFNPFYRNPGAHEQDGTGMGLTLCRRLTQRHGGNLWAESTGEGTVHFKFTLQPQGEHGSKG